MSKLRKPGYAATLLALVTVTGCQTMAALQAGTSAPTAPHYLVAVDPKNQAQVIQAIQKAGGKVSANLATIGIVDIQTSDPALIKRVATLPNVIASAPTQAHGHLGRTIAAEAGDQLGADDLAPNPGPGNEPLSGYQWGLPLCNVPDVWAKGFQGLGTTVAVLDTGVDPDNQDLAPNLDLADARSFVDSEPDIIDYNGHGSHVAGIIAASANGYGVVGVAPKATILPIKVLDKTGNGDDATIMRGIDYAVRMGASIINMSLYGTWNNDDQGRRLRKAYASAIRYAESRGALVVVCSGNDGLDIPGSGQLDLPAQAGDPVVVGAVGPVNGQDPAQFAPYTNFGAGLLSLAAPGGGMGFDPNTGAPLVQKTDLVLSTWSTHAVPHDELGVHFGPAAHMFLGGTSMATAFVSGVAALARSVQGPLHPSTFRSLLVKCTTPTGDSAHYGAGVIDARKVLTPID